MNTYGVDLMGRRRRRRHSAEFKASVIEECLRPGVSIAAVALAPEVRHQLRQAFDLLSADLAACHYSKDI